MPKKNVNCESYLKLPQEIRSLILRKLRHLRQEQDRRWVGVMQVTYSKMHEKIAENFEARKFDGALSSVPVTIYRETVAHAIVMTKEWPGIVWKAISSILDKAQVVPDDYDQDILAIVDEYVWHPGQQPFTLAYIDPKQFKENVHLKARSYGQDVLPTLDRLLSLEVTAGQSGIMNTARQEREGIAIAIDEYMLAHSPSKPSTPDDPSTPNNNEREARKLETLKRYATWGKAYLDLKKKHPEMSARSCALLIEKTDIACDCNFETIRRNMKNKKL